MQLVQAWYVRNPDMPITALSAAALQPYLSLPDALEPDLLIWTGGESRISNFMLWQSAYTEMYSTPGSWPDFDSNSLQGLGLVCAV